MSSKNNSPYSVRKNIEKCIPIVKESTPQVHNKICTVDIIISYSVFIICTIYFIDSISSALYSLCNSIV